VDDAPECPLDPTRLTEVDLTEEVTRAEPEEPQDPVSKDIDGDQGTEGITAIPRSDRGSTEGESSSETDSDEDSPRNGGGNPRGRPVKEVTDDARDAPRTEPAQVDKHGRPVRTRKPPTRLPHEVYWNRDIDSDEDIGFAAWDTEDPATYEEAMRSSAATLWEAAMDAEYKALTDLGTWELVQPPKGRKIIKSKWAYKVKRGADGEITKYKARFVAKGYSQVKGIDFDETFSPVARLATLRLLIALANKHGWKIRNSDISNAYLNAVLSDHEIYVEQPKGKEVRGPNGERLVCRLKKSLYGLRQAARLWNFDLHDKLTLFGFVRLRSDPCIYIKIVGDKIIILIIYVDDLVYTGTDEELLKEFEEQISGWFKCTHDGDLKWILGIKVQHNTEVGITHLSQEKYAEGVLEKFGMENCKGRSTPAEIQRLTSELCPKTEEERLEMSSKPYLQVLGSIGYAANSTRPDLQFAYGMAARFASNPGLGHWKGLKRMLQYLQTSKSYGLTFKRDRSEKALTITGYVDSDWAGCTDTRRSTTGYIFLVSGSPVSWSSKVQKTVARSSVEAEYMALSAAAQEAMYLKTLIEELGFEVQLPMTIFQDNQGSIFLAEGKGNHSRTKHIDIRHHFIRDLVEDKLIHVTYLPSNRNLADIFTKPLDQLKFAAHRGAMMSDVGAEHNPSVDAAQSITNESSAWACMVREEGVTHSPRELVQERSAADTTPTQHNNNIAPDMQRDNRRTYAPRDIDDIVNDAGSPSLEEGMQDIQPTDPLQAGPIENQEPWESSWDNYEDEMRSARNNWAAAADMALSTAPATQGAIEEEGVVLPPETEGELMPEAVPTDRGQESDAASATVARNTARNQQRRNRRNGQAAARRGLEAQAEIRRPHREVRAQRTFQPLQDATIVGGTITVSININVSSPGAEPQDTRRRC